MRPPSVGSRRCMIYRDPQRILDDGCLACNGSETWCDSLDERCCGMCSHVNRLAHPGATTHHEDSAPSERAEPSLGEH